MTEGRATVDEIRPMKIHEAEGEETGVPELRVQVRVGGISIGALVDTGSTRSLMGAKLWYAIPACLRPELEPLPSRFNIIGIGGSTLTCMGRATIACGIGEDGDEFDFEVVVADVIDGLVLGYDFLMAFHGLIDVRESKLSIQFPKNAPSDQEEGDMELGRRVRAAEDVIVPATTEMVIPGSYEDVPDHAADFIMETSPEFQERYQLMPARALVRTAGNIPVRVMNPTREDIRIRVGTVMGHLCEVTEARLIDGGPVNDGDYVERARGAVDLQAEEPPPTATELGPALQTLFEECSKNLTEEQRKTFHQFLIRNKDVFAENKSDLGRTDLVHHTITLSTDRPIWQPPRRFPRAKREEAEKEIERMLENGIIEESSSPFASPCVLVTKKDGTLRFCIDFRQINHYTVKDRLPVPRVDSSLEALEGSTLFSSLDLASGYWQVAMHPDDAAKTAFVTETNMYQFKVMPFGLCNAPATFCRLMQIILRGIHWRYCLAYLDDVVVFSSSFEDHLVRLEEVLDRLRKAGLKLTPKKCHLFQKSVTFLGHVVSAEGVSTCPEKIATIRKWPVPRHLRDVRAFLGLASYYRKFIDDFAETALPLYELTQKHTTFEWTERCQQALDGLKNALTTAPVLAYPTKDGEYILDTDCSNSAMGAVLSQVQDGVERVILYFSKTLSKPETRYCVTRKELLAVIRGIQHCHSYLYGVHFKVRTDHSSLRWLLGFSNPEGQLARWMELLGTYDFDVEHRPGAKHQNADGLSRRPCDEDCKHCVRHEEMCRKASHRVAKHARKDDRRAPGWIEDQEENWLQKRQEEDKNLKTLRGWLERHQKPPWEELKRESLELRKYHQMWNQLEVQGGVLRVVPSNEDRPGRGPQILLPMALRREVFDYLHSHRTGGHQGITRTMQLVTKRFYWPEMKEDLERWCTACHWCQLRKRRPGPRKAPLQQEWASQPMERLAMDILSFPTKTDDGNTCCLVVCDYFSKFAWAYALDNHKAETVADILVTEIFLVFGVSRFLHSDQGREFESELMKELCRLLEVTKTRTTPYHPQSDGLVERMNRTLLDMLSKACKNRTEDWDTHLPYVLAAYRATPHASTGCSPNLLMYGREMALPVDLIYDTSTGVPQGLCPIEYVEWVKDAMAENYDFVRNRLGKAANRQKTLYDQKAKQRNFEPGSWVLRLYPPLERDKLNPKYTGPYLVLEKTGEVTYRIQRSETSQPVVVHIDQLKQYIYDGEPPASWLPKASLEPVPEETEEQIAEQNAEDETEGEGEKEEEEEETPPEIPSHDEPEFPRRSTRQKRPPVRFRAGDDFCQD